MLSTILLSIIFSETNNMWPEVLVAMKIDHVADKHKRSCFYTINPIVAITFILVYSKFISLI